jgi:hypothetical protein
MVREDLTPPAVPPGADDDADWKRLERIMDGRPRRGNPMTFVLWYLAIVACCAVTAIVARG